MIPIGDNIPSHSKPFCNYLLIGINIALFLWELKLEVAGKLGDLVNSWGVVPARITSVTADVGGGNPATGIALLILSSSLLFHMFLHSSFSHIVGNLLFLWVFGHRSSGGNLQMNGDFVKVWKTFWGIGSFSCSTCFVAFSLV